MVAKLKDGIEQLKYKWQELSSLVKKSIILFAISAVFIGGFLFYLATKVEYGVLFTDLNSVDAGVITQDLKEKKIPYQLTDNGTTVLIAKDSIDEYRIELAVDDKLPDSSSGFELFDGASIMTTDEDRKIMYQRALTGELQRAISSLEGVQKAQVILSTPDDDLFSDNQKEATASIALTVKTNLDEASVRGIVALTVGAVENLKAENVQIVDQNGRILVQAEDENDLIGNVNDKFMLLKRNYEETLEKKVANLLEPIYGVGKAKVSINVDLDFDSKESTTTKYANPEVRSENIEATGNGDDIERAQTGQVNDNVSNVTGGEEERSSSYSRSINNELDTETTTVISAPGTIRRMTSSVVVSADIPENIRRELEALIASAVGFDEARGDQIAVQGMDFWQDNAVGEEPKKGNTPMTITLDKLLMYFVVGLAVTSLILISALVYVLLKRRNEGQESFIVEDETDVDSDTLQDEFEETVPVVADFYGDDETLETEEEFKQALEEAAQEEKIKVQDQKDRQAKQYAGDNPEVAAELIKSWLKDIK
ncbi:flagellar basal-body MS-ring/collar protein FliF [Enterococcus sp.]|uniref:flagellar basal-body MS-ring/collar protein FliF n=1 Tax=Enterococcus sp. TaxID=35783 RepID=UPI002FC9454D